MPPFLWPKGKSALIVLFSILLGFQRYFLKDFLPESLSSSDPSSWIQHFQIGASSYSEELLECRLVPNCAEVIMEGGGLILKSVFDFLSNAKFLCINSSTTIVYVVWFVL